MHLLGVDKLQRGFRLYPSRYIFCTNVFGDAFLSRKIDVHISNKLIYKFTLSYYKVVFFIILIECY